MTTKLRAPRRRPKLVARPRLREILSHAEGRSLTLVSAPAGFGKTTVLGEWSEQLSRDGWSVAWLSLDGSDNDTVRFLSYLVGSLREVEDGIGEGVLAALEAPQPPPVGVVMEVLVNDLAGAGHGLAIIFDDYHLIDSGPVHEAVAFLLERQPENVHLVIAGRTDPPLPLPKLRARDQVTELRAADLRFTLEEAAAFLNDVMGLALSTGEVAALEGVTEGWVAALQLAALSMRDRGDVSGFVESFSGSNRHVLDFLAEEVLERQPEDVKDFLFQTSMLEWMSASLCDTVTGRSGGQAMLEKVERENLFVVALDDERRWYRYHHLFADFLRGRLMAESPERARELHLEASGWYEENGSIAEAINHAFSASDHDLAARLVEHGVKGAWSRGEGPTVLRWVSALSDEAKRRRPRLILEHAQALSLVGRLDESEPLLDEGERIASEAPAREDRSFLLGYASSIRSYNARLRGDAPQSIEFARKALSLLPDDELHLRNFAAVCLGDALRVTGDLEAASETLAGAARIGRAGGHVYGTITAMAWLARLQTVRGDLRASEETLRQALDFLAEQGAELLPAAGGVHIGMGALLYERDELDEAERELGLGVERAELSREVSTLVWGYLTLSKARLARGDGDEAAEMAREASRVARASGTDLESAIAANWMVRLYLSQGNLADAEAVGRERAADTDLAEGGTEVATRVVDRLTSARLLHAHGRYDEALRLLGELQEVAEGAKRTGNLLEILTLQALALWARNEKELAVGTLARALALAEREGYVRTFADEETATGDLLSATLDVRRGKHAGAIDRVSAPYLARLQAALARGRARAGVDSRLPEPPSEREMEVLAFIAAGASNAEIAGRLFVSTSTVKTHVNNLYRKLGARSRTQALAKAREMGLL